MSKWNLLFKKNCSSEGSIHRHVGFEVIPKSKVFWPKWYRQEKWEFDEMDDEIATIGRYESMYGKWLDYMVTIDCAELYVQLEIHISYDTKLTLYLILLAKLKEYNYDSAEDLLPLTLPDHDTSAVHLVDLRISHSTLIPRLSSYLSFCYHIYSSVVSNANNDSDGKVLKVYTRENNNKVISSKSLISHITHGVDNTGNVRVWQCESILLYYLLKHKYSTLHDLCILEIGGGMTGLCGLGLALSSVLLDNANTKIREVIVTDGNPDCVYNQRTCCCMNQQIYRDIFNSKPVSDICKYACQQLRWSRNDAYGELSNILLPSEESSSVKKSIDIIIGADCLFFKEFHLDLIHTLYELLGCDIPNSSFFLSKCIYLLQPRRSGTMHLFINTIQTHDKYKHVFDILVIEDFDCEITRMHQQYMEERIKSISEGHIPLYDPDLHQPVLIVITVRQKG